MSNRSNGSRNYQRNIEELRLLASMFWPTELSSREAELSIIPKLLETQEEFISILRIDVRNLDAFFNIVRSSKLSSNLFLKHLVVLTDFGGEMLQRINKQFTDLFPMRKLEYTWGGENLSYDFKALPIDSLLNNTKLGISGRTLLNDYPINDMFQDVVAILLHGSTCLNEETAAILSKCEVGSYLGKPEQLEQFIKQRYIWVSRITGGAQANNLGQIAQDYVREYIATNLGLEDVSIVRDGHLPNVTHTDSSSSSLTTFDIVVSRNNKYVAVEVSFQVTTNSTIERKSGQARSRYEQIVREGYRIAYVIDGAGNFQRENAIRTLCSFSDCTIAFSQSELDVLCDYIRTYLDTP